MWSETALDTTLRSSGTSPASTDIVRLAEPMQCATTSSSSLSVALHTVLTARGWS